MPDTKTWIILILLGLFWFAYTYPDKAKIYTDPTFGKLNSAININNVFKGTAAKAACPETIEPVCGNGVTYDNICKATVAGVMKVTPGACTNG